MTAAPLPSATRPAQADSQAPDPRRATLHALLDEALCLAPEYGDGLSSHLPMALQALYALGADAPRLKAFFDHYRARLEPVDQVAAPGFAAPELGQFEHFPIWRERYARRLQADGLDAVMRDSLPHLMTGAAGVAFHGLIRCAHAISSGHQGELAAALAYWAARHQPVPCARAVPMEFDEWVSGLVALARQHGAAMPNRPLITQSIDDWARAPGFNAIAGALDAAKLPDVARLAARLYTHTRNFTVLHVVTASEAAHRLQQWMEPPVQQALVPALAAGCLASSVLEDGRLQTWLQTAPVGEAPGWDQLVALAVEQDDDHVIKLVEACRSLDQCHPDPVWRHTAARAVG